MYIVMDSEYRGQYSNIQNIKLDSFFYIQVFGALEKDVDLASSNEPHRSFSERAVNNS